MKNENFTFEYLPNSIILRFHMNELDLMSSPKLVSDIDSVIKNIKDTNLIIDIDRLEYIDSTGLSLIFSIIINCSKKGVTISVVCNNQNIRRLFDMFHMNYRFTFYSNIEEVFANTLE